MRSRPDTRILAMDFNFTAEQDMLRDSVARYLGDHYDFAQPPGSGPLGSGLAPGGLARPRGGPRHPRRAVRRRMHGGLGGGAVETMIVMEEIGKALVVEPYLDTVVIGGGLLRRWGGATARASGSGASSRVTCDSRSRSSSRPAGSTSRTSARLQLRRRTAGGVSPG